MEVHLFIISTLTHSLTYTPTCSPLSFQQSLSLIPSHIDMIFHLHTYSLTITYEHTPKCSPLSLQQPFSLVLRLPQLFLQLEDLCGVVRLELRAQGGFLGLALALAFSLWEDDCIDVCKVLKATCRSLNANVFKRDSETKLVRQKQFDDLQERCVQKKKNKGSPKLVQVSELIPSLNIIPSHTHPHTAPHELHTPALQLTAVQLAEANVIFCAFSHFRTHVVCGFVEANAGARHLQSDKSTKTSH